MQRRNFLNLTGSLISGSLLLGTNDLYADTSKLKPDDHVIIIGAGLAGLSAAYELTKKGIKVTVIEGRNRLGGRVFTNKLQGSDLFTELGADWVGASHIRMQNLCKELNLTLVDNSFDYSLILDNKFYSKENYPVNEIWKKKYNDLLASFKKLSLNERKPFDKIDWWRYLKSQDIPSVQLDIHELEDSTDFGESIRHISAAMALEEFGQSDENDEMDFKVKGGNGKIAQALADKIGSEKILLNKKVAKINQKLNSVEVICHDGTVYNGNKIICCVPIWSIMNIIWNPVLPAIQMDAIRQLEYSRVVKNTVVFKERFWKDDSTSILTDTLSHYIFHSTKTQSSTKGTLTSYAVGDKAYVLSKMNDQHIVKELCEVLKPAYGDILKYVDDGKVYSYYWGSDEYTQGAFAIYRTGQWYELRKEIGKMHNNTLFAGEHLANWQGFMEGAVQTGQDAAFALLKN